MALEERSNNTVFLNIADGKLVRKYKSPVDGAVEVKTEDGEIYYKKEYTSVTGYLTYIQHKENEFKGQKYSSWNITLSDNGEKYCVQVGEISNSAITLLCALFNADLTKKIKIKPYAIVNGDKKNKGVTVYSLVENGEIKLENHFYKSELVGKAYIKKYFNGFPAMPENADKETYQINRLLQIKFLRSAVLTDLAGKLAQVTKEQAPEEVVQAESTNGFDDGDLPF